MNEPLKPNNPNTEYLRKAFNEQLNAQVNRFYNERQRKIKEIIKHPPTMEQLVKYELAKIAWDYLEKYPDFYYDEADLRGPVERREIIYAETEEEWAKRLESLGPVTFNTVTVNTEKEKDNG